MVVSFGPHAPGAGYKSSTADTRFLLGPAYTILRPEYWDSARPVHGETVRNVLVTTGGADPDGCMPSWMRALDEVDAEFSVTAVVGPFFADPGTVHEAAAGLAHTVRVIVAPPMLRPLLARADVAVTAAGQTIYECAALGLPTIAAEIAPNQRRQLGAFDAAGAMISAGRASERGAPERIAVHVAHLCADPMKRASLREKALDLVDPRGALTVAREMTSALVAEGFSA
jgi:spore coat polysaccharide biosynthesis predicted glycosyltransferase SpsG